MTILQNTTETNTINYKVKVNTNDAKALYLADKFVAGDNITLTVITSSSSTYGSQLKIDAAITSAETNKVKVSSGDTPQYLETAITGVVSSGITVSPSTSGVAISYTGALLNNADVNIVTANLTNKKILSWDTASTKWVNSYNVSASPSVMGSSTTTLVLESQIKKYVDGANHDSVYYVHISKTYDNSTSLYYIAVDTTTAFTSITTFFPTRQRNGTAITTATSVVTTAGSMAYIGDVVAPF